MIGSSSIRVLRTAALLALLAATFVAPTVSATPLPDYGSTANCKYKITESGKYGWTEALLKKLAVKPPTIYAKHGTQRVGWQFIVQRSLDRERGPWTVTYRSHIQKANATTSSAAAFQTMRVEVSVPAVEYPEDVYYTVALKLFWYKADGSIQSKVDHPMSTLHVIVGHQDDRGTDDICQGLARQYFD